MYATGSAASCAAVLQALATFATSAGWTVDNNAAYTGGWWLAVHKGSTYLDYVVPSGDGLITVYGATGFNGGSAPNAQANTSPGVTTNPGQLWNNTLNTGPYSAYHFFSSGSGTYLHCMIEVSSGVFAQFHAGKLNTAGTATPAIYTAVSNWYSYLPSSSGDSYTSWPDQVYNGKPFTDDYGAGHGTDPSTTYLGCTVDATMRWFHSYGGSSPARLKGIGNSGYASQDGWSRLAQMSSPNTFNGLSVLVPIPFFAERASGNIYSMIGEAPDIRFFNMMNNNAKDEITLGSDVWKVFPLIANNPLNNIAGGSVSSYPYGLAFKKSA